MPDSMLLIAVTLVFAAALGELTWRHFGWPRPVAYAGAGVVLGLTGSDHAGLTPVLRLAIDGALALLLFEAGARLNLRWLGRNPALLATSLAEAGLSAVVVFAVCRGVGIGTDAATACAIIAMSVSPAVVQRVIGECGAAGQVTERLRLLSTLNTLYSIVAMQLFSAGLLMLDPQAWQAAWLPVVLSFGGSLLLGAVLGSVLVAVARRMDLRSDSAVVLLLCFVLAALLIARQLQFSTLLMPLLAGLWLRNRSDRPWIWPHQFGSAGAALVLVLFVTTGASISTRIPTMALTLAVSILVARWLAKGVAILAVARPSGISWQQALALGGTLLPMSATAWVLALDFAATHKTAGTELLPVILAAIAVIDVLAPIVMFRILFALREIGRER